MAKEPELPYDFKWHQSAKHIDLLRIFVKRKSVNKIIEWDRLAEGLGEHQKIAIERFIRDGVLIPATINEALGYLFLLEEIKGMLRDRKLDQTGSKKRLVQKLILSDYTRMKDLVDKSNVMKCSPAGLDIISYFDNIRELAVEQAKKDVFDALILGDAKKAQYIYREHKVKFFPLSHYDYNNENDIRNLTNLLQINPKFMFDTPAENVAKLKAIAGLCIFWNFQSEDHVLFSENLSCLENDKIAVNYLLVQCKIKTQLDLYRNESEKFKVQIVFPIQDIKSCDLCKKLDGCIMDSNSLPELPIIGCTSDTGCGCRIDQIYEYDDSYSSDHDDDAYTVSVPYSEEEDSSDLFLRLTYLKKMLDDNLITEEDYEDKKKEILSKF